MGSLLPIWVPFSFWTNLNTKRESPIALSKCLETWFKQFDQGRLWPIVESAMEDGRLLLLVDGLDEWTDETAARTTSHLLQTYIQIRNLPAVLVSRPHGFERVSIQGAEWQVGRLAALSKHQQRALIVKWLSIHRRADSQQSDSAGRTTEIVQDVQKAADEFISQARKVERSLPTRRDTPDAATPSLPPFTELPSSRESLRSIRICNKSFHPRTSPCGVLRRNPHPRSIVH